jgi:2-dehydro-3-deoxyphosphogluconate aldolase/(4S)-4-hydroxy-2-oxoglutarate aldolase
MTAAELRAGPVAELIRGRRLVAVLRRIAPRERLLELVGDLADMGTRIFEVTFDAVEAADDLIACSEMLAARGDGPFAVGAGTVRTPEQLRIAQQAGAAFAVSPVLDPGLVRSAINSGLAFVPGAATPTEADQAWRCGATFVKLFPASSLGPAFIRELRGPMPEIETIVTGGVDAGNARALLDAGAVAVGIGSALVRADAEQQRALVESVRDWGR